MTRYHAVALGGCPGIYTQLEDARANALGVSNPTIMIFKTFDNARNYLLQFNLDVDYGHHYSDGAMFWFAYDVDGGNANPPDPKHPDTLVAFCDGSAIGNGQRHCAGGYACVFPHDEDLGEVGQVDWATNNRAEYTAALVALERANERDPDQNEAMYIFSDSKVLIDSMTNWISRWERNGWMTIRGTEVKNRDILEQLLDTQGNRPVYWNHVRAHTNNRDWKSFWNDIADRDAREMPRDNYYNH